MTGIAIPANHAVSGPSSTRGRSHSARPVPQAAHHAATISRNHKLSVSLARHHSYWTVSNQSVEFNAILLPILIMIDRFALTAKLGNICKPRLAVARRALWTAVNASLILLVSLNAQHALRILFLRDRHVVKYAIQRHIMTGPVINALNARLESGSNRILNSVRSATLGASSAHLIYLIQLLLNAINVCPLLFSTKEFAESNANRISSMTGQSKTAETALILALSAKIQLNVLLAMRCTTLTPTDFVRASASRVQRCGTHPPRSATLLEIWALLFLLKIQEYGVAEIPQWLPLVVASNKMRHPFTHGSMKFFPVVQIKTVG